MSSVAVEQALHGYEAGHRMLASSANLVADDRRVLVRQTDHPDAGRNPGWDALLSTYPLPSGLQALSMTWPAPELPRPGCVWTHTLLLGAGALRLPDLTPLLTLFVRPEELDHSIGRYRRHLELPSSVEVTAPDEDERLWVQAIVWALLSPPRRQVWVSGLPPSDHGRHRILLGALSSPWSSARQGLAFADAPLTPRDLHGRPYDLMLREAVARRKPVDKEVRQLRGVPSATPPDWVTRLSHSRQSGDGLRDYLEYYGRDYGVRLESAPVLVSVYQALERRDESSAGTIVRLIADSFPSVEDAATLKQDALGGARTLVGCRSPLPDSCGLAALIRTAQPDAFDAETLNFEKRVRQLARVDPSALVDALVDAKRQHPFAAIALKVVASEITVRQLMTMLPDRSHLAEDILVRRPSLAHDPELWGSLDPSTIWNLVRTQRRRDDRVATLRAAMAARVEIHVESVVAAWKDASLLLEALTNVRADVTTAARWVQAVSQQDLVKWLEAQPDLAGAVAEAAVAQVGVDGVATIPGGRIEAALDTWSSIETNAIVLGAALLKTSVAAWSRPATIAFAKLAPAAREDALGTARDLLDKCLPSDGVAEWDFVTRLARSLNRAFKTGVWPVTDLLSIQQPQDFEAVLSADQHAGLARRLFAASAEQRVTVAEWQQEILARTIGSKADGDALTRLLAEIGRMFWPLGR